jgi:hypothetical protein
MKSEFKNASRSTRCTFMRLLACILWLAACGIQPAHAGDINSPGLPGAGSGMYTLQAIHDYLYSGTIPSIAGTFQEPGAGPGSTMINTKDIYNSATGIKTDADNCNAVAADVLAGKTFFATTGITRGTNWGPTSGAMVNNGAGGTITPSTINQTIAAGFWSSANTVSGDADLVAGNIKKDTVIFGVTGTLAGGGLPKTGQTTSYATGDDGDLQVGIARSYTYTDPITTEATNTLIDNATGLTWIRDHTLVNGTGGATGGNVDISGTLNWPDAISRCNDLVYAGKSDWRLPNVYELLSICVLDVDLVKPKIDHAAFPNTANDSYWSSTTCNDSTSLGLYVSFSITNLAWDHKTLSAHYLRAVRGP